MIHGNGVGSKYNAILAARQRELAVGLPRASYPAMYEKLAEFIDELRNGTVEQLDEWYAIYCTKD